MMSNQLRFITVVLGLFCGSQSFGAHCPDWDQVRSLTNQLVQNSDALESELSSRLSHIIERDNSWKVYAIYDVIEFNYTVIDLAEALEIQDYAQVLSRLGKVKASASRARGSLRLAHFEYEIDELFDRCSTWINQLERELRDESRNECELISAVNSTGQI